MIKKLALIFCGTGFLNCVAISIVIQIIKGAHPTQAPEWMVLWFLITGAIAGFGLLCVGLNLLGFE